MLPTQFSKLYKGEIQVSWLLQREFMLGKEIKQTSSTSMCLFQVFVSHFSLTSLSFLTAKFTCWGINEIWRLNPNNYPLRNQKACHFENTWQKYTRDFSCWSLTTFPSKYRKYSLVKIENISMLRIFCHFTYFQCAEIYENRFCCLLNRLRDGYNFLGWKWTLEFFHISRPIRWI